MSDESLRTAYEARERQIAELRAALADLATVRAEADSHEAEADAQRERAERAEREAVAQRDRADALEAEVKRLSGGLVGRLRRR